MNFIKTIALIKIGSIISRKQIVLEYPIDTIMSFRGLYPEIGLFSQRLIEFDWFNFCVGL